MVHLASGEGVGLLASGAFVAVPVLHLWALGGVVSCLLALETGDVAQILLRPCSGVGTILISVSSIPIAILMAIMVMSITSMMRMTTMVMMVVPSILNGS